MNSRKRLFTFPLALGTTPLGSAALASTRIAALPMPAATCIGSSASTVTAEFLLQLLFYWPFAFMLWLLYWIVLLTSSGVSRV